MKATKELIGKAWRECGAISNSPPDWALAFAQGIAEGLATQPDHSGDGGDLQGVGFIVQDDVHGWHFAPTVAWTYLGKGRALYARSNQAAPVPQDGSDEWAALKQAALAATPQNIDSAESIDRFEDGSHIECPTCGGDGCVPREADFCNYDGTAIGVQFYGVGSEFGAAEAYFRAAKPSVVLAMITRLESAEAALASNKAVAVAVVEPIPMLLFCPQCGTQHVDAPEAEQILGDDEGLDVRFSWENPPHRSHLCHACGCIWRPAEVATTGVETIATVGKRDNWDGPGCVCAEPATVRATPPAQIASTEAVPVAWEFSSPEGERPKLAFLTSKPSTREHYENQGWRVLPLYTHPAAAQPGEPT